ncbi:MAG: PGF-pre-PGF domain-containing protein, partial [Candidatus Methanoperedens sp.]|nr:PGF-pre-PGF domain-containing protein [Candidatus Methanoperedens sp.]
VNGGVYSYNLTDLVEGSNTITVIATDSVGNQATASTSITMDTTAPTLNITPVTSPTNRSYQIITGNVSDGTVTVNGTNAPVNGGVYSYNLTDLVEGSNTITVIATDSVGNQATASTSITVDTTAPTLNITPVTSPTNRSYQIITGNVSEAGAGMGTVTVNGTAASISGTVYTYNLTGLAQGANTITVIATDSVGNQATASTSITVDTTAPTLTITTAPTSPVDDTTGAIRTFNITANQTVNVTWYINGTSVQTNGSATSASYTNNSAALGTWNVSAIATNANGSALNIWMWIVSAVPTYSVSLTNISALSQEANATNATYILNLTNNGTAADSYSLNLTNLNGASIAGINISSPYPLDAGMTKIFALNVTHTLSGTFVVNVTATSQNATSKSASISSTTNVNRTIVNSTIGTIINASTFITNDTLEIAAPSGHATIIVPNGTNASVGGVALTSISVDSLAQVNSTFAANLGSSDKLIGENLSLGPEGAQFSPDIQIRLNYTDAQLTAAGITDESTLRINFYNTTTNTWVEQTPYILNTTGKYIIANISHFSTFTLLGTITTTTSSGGGSGGTGGGSSGVSTSEPFDNIAMSERYDKNLIANTPVTYVFKAPELGIYEIAVTGKESENEIALRVEVLKGTSKLVAIQAPGLVYRNVNVWAGTKRLKEAVVRFKVENSWLSSNNLARSDIKMVKWDSSEWVLIETTEKNKDDKYTYYEAKTDTFSVFAITGMKGGAVPTEVPAGAVTETTLGQTVTPTAPTTGPTKKGTPAFEGIVAIAAIALLVASLKNNRKRR